MRSFSSNCASPEDLNDLSLFRCSDLVLSTLKFVLLRISESFPCTTVFTYDARARTIYIQGTCSVLISGTLVFNSPGVAESISDAIFDACARFWLHTKIYIEVLFEELFGRTHFDLCVNQVTLPENFPIRYLSPLSGVLLKRGSVWPSSQFH